MSIDSISFEKLLRVRTSVKHYVAPYVPNFAQPYKYLEIVISFLSECTSSGEDSTQLQKLNKIGSIFLKHIQLPNIPQIINKYLLKTRRRSIIVSTDDIFQLLVYFGFLFGIVVNFKNINGCFICETWDSKHFLLDLCKCSLHVLDDLRYQVLLHTCKIQNALNNDMGLSAWLKNIPVSSVSSQIYLFNIYPDPVILKTIVQDILKIEIKDQRSGQAMVHFSKKKVPSPIEENAGASVYIECSDMAYKNVCPVTNNKSTVLIAREDKRKKTTSMSERINSKTQNKKIFMCTIKFKKLQSLTDFRNIMYNFDSKDMQIPDVNIVSNVFETNKVDFNNLSDRTLHYDMDGQPQFVNLNSENYDEDENKNKNDENEISEVATKLDIIDDVHCYFMNNNSSIRNDDEASSSISSNNQNTSMVNTDDNDDDFVLESETYGSVTKIHVNNSRLLSIYEYLNTQRHKFNRFPEIMELFISLELYRQDLQDTVTFLEFSEYCLAFDFFLKYNSRWNKNQVNAIFDDEDNFRHLENSSLMDKLTNFFNNSAVCLLIIPVLLTVRTSKDLYSTLLIYQGAPDAYSFFYFDSHPHDLVQKHLHYLKNNFIAPMIDYFSRELKRTISISNNKIFVCNWILSENKQESARLCLYVQLQMLRRPQTTISILKTMDNFRNILEIPKSELIEWLKSHGLYQLDSLMEWFDYEFDRIGRDFVLERSMNFLLCNDK